MINIKNKSLRLFVVLGIVLFSLSFLSCASTSAKDQPQDSSTETKEPEDKSKERKISDTADTIKEAVSGKGCITGNCENSEEATFIYESGEKYVGPFKNGQPEGKGVMTYTNGDVYTGVFKAGKRTGYASYVFSNGDKYIGEFVDGQMRGLGNYIWKDGSVLKGDFEENGQKGGGTFLKEGQDLRHKGRDCLIDNRIVKCQKQ